MINQEVCCAFWICRELMISISHESMLSSSRNLKNNYTYSLECIGSEILNWQWIILNCVFCFYWALLHTFLTDPEFIHRRATAWYCSRQSKDTDHRPLQRRWVAKFFIVFKLSGSRSNILNRGALFLVVV